MRWLAVLLGSLLIGGVLGTLIPPSPCRALYCRPGICYGGDCGVGCSCVIPPGRPYGSCWGGG